MLHTLINSPWHCDIYTMICMLRSGDDLLLIQDGVLAAVNNNSFSEIFKNAQITVSALKEDLKARGIINQISAKIAIVSYADFVNLVIKHKNQMNW